MIAWLKRIFRFRTLLVILTVGALTLLTFAYLTPFIHPNTIPLLPLVGLGYWIIFGSVLILLVIWSIMKSRWSLIILGFILIGGKLHFRTFSFGSDEENINGTELHVLSYNVRLFDLYNTIQSKPVI